MVTQRPGARWGFNL